METKVLTNAEIKTIDEKNRTLTAVISTDDVDRDNEVVRQAGIKFDQIPKFLWSHRNNELPLGEVKSVSIGDKRSEATLKFATAESNPMAEHVFNSFKEKLINSFSIGFKTLKDSFSGSIRTLEEIELLEISAVNIPANRYATAKSDNLVDKSKHDNYHKSMSEENQALKDKVEEQAATIKSLKEDKIFLQKTIENLQAKPGDSDDGSDDGSEKQEEDEITDDDQKAIDALKMQKLIQLRSGK